MGKSIILFTISVTFLSYFMAAISMACEAHKRDWGFIEVSDVSQICEKTDGYRPPKRSVFLRYSRYLRYIVYLSKAPVFLRYSRYLRYIAYLNKAPGKEMIRGAGPGFG